MDAQGYRDEITGNDPGYVGDNVSISSGSLSPSLGEMWRYGCPRSPDWDSHGDGGGEIDDGAEEKEVSEKVTSNTRYVLEGPLSAAVRAFLVPHDVLL